MAPGFAEVQVITAGFDLRGELKGPDAVRFLRSLPRGSRGPLWAVPAGRTLRVTSRPAAGAVCLAGPDRLRTMLPLLRFARALRVYGPSVADGGGPVSSVWELEMPGMRYVLTLSPQHSRGFSGEGAVLDALSTDEAAGDADLVGALLSFEPRVEPDLLAERSGLTLERTKAALVQLGTSGRVGFDAAEAAFFHRELPYDPARVAGLNPGCGPRASSLRGCGPVHGRGNRRRGEQRRRASGPFRGRPRHVHLSVVVRPSGRARTVQARPRRPDGPPRDGRGGGAMSTWDDVQKAIDDHDVDRTARLVAGLGEDGRREIAKDLPGRLKAMRAASEYGFLDRGVLEPLMVAGAGTIGGPAGVATWLCRRELRLWWSADRYARLCAALDAVTSHRPAEWRAEVARRVADRIRASDGEWAFWYIAAAFTRSAGAAPRSRTGSSSGG